jgi:ribosome-binding factor A
MRTTASPSHRRPRIEEQIRQDLSSFIPLHVKDPRVGLITLTRVVLTVDYAHAKVFFRVLKGDTQTCTQGLNQAAGFLRRLLFKQLHIHTVPTLHFIFDDTVDKAAQMDLLIAQAMALSTSATTSAIPATSSVDEDTDTDAESPS